MSITDLIDKLQAIKDSYGDINVYQYLDDDNIDTVDNASVDTTYSDKPIVVIKPWC